MADQVFDDKAAVIDSVLPDIRPKLTTKSAKKRRVLIDDAHPFNLDSYISQYQGRTAITRLRFIAEESEELAPQALQLAVQYLLQTRDSQLYSKTVNEYNSLPSSSSDLIPFDSQWVEEISEKNANERDRLETELKTYTSNMIKESIRMGHRDLGDYHWSTGDYQMALKHYNKSREFCTTSQHVLEFSIAVLQLLIEQQSYAHIPTYLFKAQSAFNPSDGSKEPTKKTGPAPPAGSAAAAVAASASVNPEREKNQAKIDYASALGAMAQGYYDQAALAFTRLTKNLDDWFGKLVSPADIAVYGTLCALAALPRSSVKVNLVENETFAYYLEQEPYARELLDAFISSNFKVVLELLDHYSSRHVLDIHLHSHIGALTTEIRNRAIVLYFQPFSSVRLEKMSTAFGLPTSEIERLAVLLIRDGRIQGRIDSKNKILKAKDIDPRTALFKRAVKVGNDAETSSRKLLLRMRLIQADLIVKAPKAQRDDRQQQQQHQSQFPLQYIDTFQ